MGFLIMEIYLAKYEKSILFDDCDLELICSFKWRCVFEHSQWYAVSSNGIKMHRLLLDCPKNMVIDHINGNGLDNRRSNLRICTIGENLRNHKLKNNNTSGFIGIHKMKSTCNYQSYININGEKHYCGTFKNIQDAIIARNEAAKKYHGEFAVLNIVPNYDFLD